MTKVFGWSPTEMREREEAFAALIDKHTAALGRRAVALLNQQHVVVAASTPMAPFDLGEFAGLTAMWQGVVTAEIMPALSDIYLESAGVIWQGIDEAFDELAIPVVSDVFAEEYLAA